MATRRLIASLLAVTLLLTITTSSSAQSTRVEAIAEEQAEKAKQLGKEGPSEAEMVVRRVLLSPLLNGGDGMYPWFGSVYSGTGVAVGAGFLKRLENAAYVNLQSGVSLNNSLMLRGTYAAPQLWRGMLQLDTTAQWLNARGVSFYGFGQNSSKHDRDRFNYTPMQVDANATVKPIRFVSMTGTYTFLNLSTERKLPRFPQEDLGLDRDLTYHITRGTVAFDWRPAAGYSTRGGYYRASFERNQEITGEPFTFNAQEYEVVQQVPLVHEQFVFAARGLVTLTSTANGHNVPVVLAPFLGSGSTLRGYANRRFTDRNRALLTGEYRWRPSRYLDMAIFMDAGQVSPDHHFDRDGFDVTWGIGARFHGPTFSALRVELARGREGMRLIFAGAQPF